MSVAAAPAPEATPVTPPAAAPASPPAVTSDTPAAASAPANGTASAAPADAPAPVAAIDEPALQPSGVRVVPDSEWGKFKAAAEKKAQEKAEKAAEAAQVEAAKRWKQLGFVDEKSAFEYLAFMRAQAPGAVAPAPAAAVTTEAPAAPAAPAPVVAAPTPAAVSAPVDPDLAQARAEAAAAKLELEAVKAGAKYPDWAVLQMNKHLATLPVDQQKTFSAKAFFAQLKTSDPTMFGVTPAPPVREVPATTTPGGTAPPAPASAVVTKEATRVDFSKLPPAEQEKYLRELEMKAQAARSQRAAPPVGTS